MSTNIQLICLQIKCTKQKRKELIYIGIIAAVVLSLIIIVLLYRLQTGKAEIPTTSYRAKFAPVSFFNGY